MSQQHRSELLKIAQKDFESLNYNIAQATTIFALRECVEKMAKILQRLLHDHLLDQNEVMQGRTANPTGEKTPAAKALAPALAPQAPHTTPEGSLPSLDNDPRSVLPGGTVQIPGMPPVDVDPNVVNVVVTPQGSKVVAGPAAPASAPPTDPSGLPTI